MEKGVLKILVKLLQNTDQGACFCEILAYIFTKSGPP